MQLAPSRGRRAIATAEREILWAEGPGDHIPPLGRFAHCGPLHMVTIHEPLTMQG